MMSDIDISVIIPVYNAGALINRCLDSIFNQIDNYNVEVILVDDGSKDNSVEQIKKRQEQDRIRLFQQQNSGPAKARNKGITEARGKYIAFLDADDYWLPGFFDKTFNFLLTHPECVAVSVAQRHLTTSGSYEAPFDWDKLTGGKPTVLNDFFSFWADYNHVCTGSILLRTDIAKASGGQREDMRICEDLEYWALIASYGKVGYMPKLLFVSDGAKVTKNIGWVQKHLPRWKAAVPADDWQKRILDKCPELVKDKGFLKARGRIARNLAYSILLSKRYNLAKEQIKKYGEDFPKDNMSRLLCLACQNPINWFIISRILVYREYHRE
ncbi:MAG: glycosyltransferase [Muribaculum sp.]|nr:glycosyltransferase [Muribaculum sp.]